MGYYVFHDNLATPILENRLGDSAGVFGAAWIKGKADKILGASHAICATELSKASPEFHNVRPEVRSVMSEGTDTKGGFMVPEIISANMIDLLRAKNQVINAGALTIPLPALTTRVCKIVSDPVAQFVAENGQIPEDNNMSIGAIDFIAHKLACLVKVSTELIQDSSNAGYVIQDCISKAMSAALDSACLYGTGVGQPQGLCLNTDINTYSLGINGNSLGGYEDLLYGLQTIVTANAPIPNVALMSPRTLVSYSLQKDGDGRPLIKPELIQNMQFLDTTKIPTNQVQGTSNDCSTIVMGTFSNLVIGIRSQLEMLVLKERFAEFGQIAFLVTMRLDTNVIHPPAFCKITGVRP